MENKIKELEEKLLLKEQECEELKREKRNFYNFLTNKYNYGSFRPMWGAYLLRRFFKKDLGDFFDEKAYKMADTIEEKEKQLEQLKAENERLKHDNSYEVGALEKTIDNLVTENEELKRKITEIFACLIKANRSGIITDTLWVGTITTLWDYITQTLGIEGDQTQIEKQILQKIREVEG